MRVDQVVSHGLLHVGRSHLAIAIQVLLEVIRRPHEIVVEVELVRLAAEAAHALHARERSEEHTSELQSLAYLVCRLLLEKKKTTKNRWLRSRRQTPNDL